MYQATFDLVQIAAQYLDAGLSILPIAAGSKRPAEDCLPTTWDETKAQIVPTWRPYQERRAHAGDVVRWLRQQPQLGLGIIGGAISGGLVILDIESVPAAEAWQAAAVQRLGAELVATLPVVATGKGRHIYFRMENAPGNRKLAMAGKSVLAETRGEGGYVLAPPSVHPSGAIYTLLSGDLLHIPQLTADQAQACFDAAKALTPPPPAAPSPPPPPPTPRPQPAPGPSVIAAFNQAYTIEQILTAHGYTPAAAPGRFIRPGGASGSVVVASGRSSHYNPHDALYCEAPAGGIQSHDAFSAWCGLEHAGQTGAAVRAAAIQLGLTPPPPRARPSPAAPPPDDPARPAAGRVLGLGGAPRDGAVDTWPYFISAGGIWMHRTEKDGAPRLPLPMTNWTAEIAAEIAMSDGERVEEAYAIRAHCGNRTRELTMTRAEFESEAAVARIVAALGAKARVNPVAQSRFIVDAIKACSPTPVEHTIYNHMGWVGERYLFANGFVDRTGWQPASSDTASRAHLPAQLERYRLSPPTDASIPDGLVLLDDLLALAPSAVLVPLIGAVLLAPLLRVLESPAPMVHICGPTGTRKTAICCCALSLFGDFARAGQPTDTWTSTSNSVQKRGWHLKDAPMVLDDYKVKNVKERDVTFLLQNYGDNMARGRLDAEANVRSAYPIRGVLISSGEDQPEGEASTLARILTVDIARGAVNLPKLTTLQTQAAYLHALTAAYLQWLAGQDAAAEVNDTHLSVRNAILTKLEQTEHATNPGRVASNVATLYVAWDRFCTFLVAGGHWPADRADAWRTMCKRELVTLAKRQLALTTNERYSQLFLESLRALIASGKVLIQSSNTGTALPGQTPVGYANGDGVYLIAQVAYDEVAKATRLAGRQLGYSLRALSQLLQQDGLLQSTEPPSLVIRRRVNGVPTWCWHLPTGVLD